MLKITDTPDSDHLVACKTEVDRCQLALTEAHAAARDAAVGHWDRIFGNLGIVENETVVIATGRYSYRGKQKCVIRWRPFGVPQMTPITKNGAISKRHSNLRVQEVHSIC